MAYLLLVELLSEHTWHEDILLLLPGHLCSLKEQHTQAGTQETQPILIKSNVLISAVLVFGKKYIY